MKGDIVSSLSSKSPFGLLRTRWAAVGIFLIHAGCATVAHEQVVHSSNGPFPPSQWNTLHTVSVESPSSAVFSRDGRYLFVGSDLAKSITTFNLETSSVRTLEVGVLSSLLALSSNDRWLYFSDRYGHLGRVDVETWEVLHRPLTGKYRITDIAASASGDQLYVGEYGASVLHIVSAPFWESQQTPSGRDDPIGVEQMYLDGGPAAQIAILGGSERALLLATENLPTVQEQRAGRLSAQLTLNDLPKRRLVDWYWSLSGEGTSSIASGRTADGEIIFAIEEGVEQLVAYRFDADRLELSRTPSILFRSGHRHPAEQSRLAASPGGETAIVFRPRSRLATVVRVGASEGKIRVTDRWSAQAQHPIEAAAVNHGELLLALVSPSADTVEVLRFSGDCPPKNERSRTR